MKVRGKPDQKEAEEKESPRPVLISEEIINLYFTKSILSSRPKALAIF